MVSQNGLDSKVSLEYGTFGVVILSLEWVDKRAGLGFDSLT